MSLILEKSKKAGLSLEKKGLLRPPVARVAAALDVSGSTHGMFKNGSAQGALDQILGAGLQFDDNGEVDVYVFDDQHAAIGTASEADFGTFIEQRVYKSGAHLWGGTSYAPCMEQIERDMFPPPAGLKQAFKSLFAPRSVEPDVTKIPVVVFFLTDGENNDHDAAESVLARSTKYPIYWNLVGVGYENFKWLGRMADKYGNVGFLNLSSMRQTDEAMYDALFTDEFVAWAKAFPPK